MDQSTSERSRRTFLRLVAASGAAAGLGSIASAQLDPGEPIELGGVTEAWQGRQPAAIDGMENPTLELEAGQTYVVEWENVDGQPHNFAIITAAGEEVVRSEIIEAQGEIQAVEFEATEDMAEYYCEVHPDTMRGDVEIVGGEPVDQAEGPAMDVPIAGQIPGGETVGLQQVATGLPGLTDFQYVGGDDQERNFIVTQTGQIYVHRPDSTAGEAGGATGEPEDDGETDESDQPMDDEDSDGTQEPNSDVPTPDDMDVFLDIEDRLVDLGIEDLGGYDERGLLGLAFHPEYQTNRTFYVRYSAPAEDAESVDVPEDFDHVDKLVEFVADENGEEADPNSARTILEIPQPQDNHNGGAVGFGPDGYLYTSVGDGGNVHDIGTGHVEDWYEENEGGNAQDTQENLLGGIHRIDVDPEADDGTDGIGPGETYAIPDDNPLAGTEHLEEFYAWGFRNPYGMRIDDEGTVFTADAGQHLIESAYLVERGGNYSWNVKEGSFCFSPANPLEPPEDCPNEVDEDVPDPRGGEPLLDPIVEFRHKRVTQAFIDSSVIVGGYRYQGEEIDALGDKLVFANWSSEGVVEADGELLTATPPDGFWEDGGTGETGGDEEGTDSDTGDDETADGTWDLEELVIENADEQSLNRYIYGVFRDEAGEPIVLTNTSYRPFSDTGTVYRIVPEGQGERIPAPEETETVDPEEETADSNDTDEGGGNESAAGGSDTAAG